MSKEKKRKNGIKESGKRSRNQKKKLKGVLTACIVILVLLVIGLIAYEIVVNTKAIYLLRRLMELYRDRK